MAKLHNYYVLCPLIDQKSFLGLSIDKDEECVLVTLGRNVVNKYRLSDQKQIIGWNSKDHITSTVIYDKEQESYVGVFNNNIIKMWQQESDNLDKMKKYKFTTNIFKIVPRDTEGPLVIFSNGNCASLTHAIENRKNELVPLLKDSEKIVDLSCYDINQTQFVCYAVKNNKEKYEIIYSPIRAELGDLDKSKLSKEKILRNNDINVIGVHIVMSIHSVFVLWSDAKMTMFNLITKSWKFIGNVPWISTMHKVSMAWMGKNHLIIFGSNTDQDGAIIMAYNVILGVGSCKYPMKMYTEGAKLYCIHGRIILEASNHIGMLPYILEPKRNLSSLLGSHEIVQDDVTETPDWGLGSVPMYDVSNDVKELLNMGLTERNICGQLIPSLLEKKKIKEILNIMQQIRDVPESILIQLLNFTLKAINPENVRITDLKTLNSFYSSLCINKNMENITLLNYLLQLPFSDALMIPHLKSGLTMDDTLFLICYIFYFVTEPKFPIDANYETKLLDWCTLLFDAFYQQFLMTKDDKVTFVLENTLKGVNELIEHVNVINNIMPTLNKLLSGKEYINEEEILPYAIELIEI